MTEKSIKGRESYLKNVNNISASEELLKETNSGEGFCPERQMESGAFVLR